LKTLGYLRPHPLVLTFWPPYQISKNNIDGSDNLPYDNAHSSSSYAKQFHNNYMMCIVSKLEQRNCNLGASGYTSLEISVLLADERVHMVCNPQKGSLRHSKELNPPVIVVLYECEIFEPCN
jgi:hypothetical protein